MFLDANLDVCSVVGPVGLGLCWRKMAIVFHNNSIIEIIAQCILGWTVFQMAVLLCLVGWKAIRHRAFALEELKHPTHFIFGMLVPLYFCLISSFILRWSQPVAQVFWYIGICGDLLFIIYVGHRHLVQPIPVAGINSFYLFGPLPLLLAMQLAPYAPKDLLLCGWSIGTVWYAYLHVVLVFRWMHIALPPKKERPAMWLLVAASSDSVLSWVAAVGFNEMAKVLFFFSLFQVAVLLSLLWRSFRWGFAPVWWMTTLPACAFASTWISYGSSMGNIRVQYVGVACVVAATAWILYLYLMTFIKVAKKDLLPKSPHKPPVDATPLK